ncbi:MAG: DUF4848 domain-containing protein, partial [Bacteroidales bacterium]|nr:DUF4848 domain-containing protein [Bacteroidales bacterium]
CSKEQDSIDNITPNFSKELTVLEISKEQKMLSFESKEDMQKTVSELMFMDESKRAEWYKAQGGFESQEAFMWQVIDELTAAKTVEEVRSIQKRYSNFFIWNNNEADEDMNPYIPSSEYGYSYVCNRNGEVLIAGEVCNFNNAKTLEETRQYRWFEPFREQAQTRAVEINEWRNHLYVSNGSSRRFWIKVGWVSDYTIPPGGQFPGILYRKEVVDFYAEKKVVFWIKYRTQYSLKYESHSDWNMNSYLFRDVWNARPGFYTTPELDPNHKITMTTQFAPDPQLILTGRSRGTGTLEGTLLIQPPYSPL